MKKEEFFLDLDNLPEQLSKEETHRLLGKVQQGDKEALTTIVKHNIRFVIYIVINSYLRIPYNKKDLISIGNIGLIKAAKTYNKSKDVLFSTYASKCINNEILMFLRKLKREQKNPFYSLNTQIAGIYEEDKDYEEATTDRTINIEEDYEKKVTYKAIQDIIEKLPDREKEIIKLFFGFYNNKTYSQQEIAKMMSVGQPRISRLITRTLEKIKQQLNEEGIIELNSNTQSKSKRKVNK